jgi:hypothetical protein
MERVRRAKAFCEQSALWVILVLSLATSLVGCSSGDDDESAPPKTQPSPLEKITLVTYEGFGPTSPAGSECRTESYPDTESVVASSRELSWDYCQLNADFTHAALEQGSRTLTEAEFKTVTDALGQVQVTHGDSCGADADVVTLDVQKEDGVDLYANDFYAGCPGELQAGRSFASGLENLANVTRALAQQH